MNAFQTEARDAGRWRAHHPGRVLHRGGRPRRGPGSAGEYLLDVRTAARRTALARVAGR